MRKIRQVRADEEFHESPQGPDALECAYGTIPAAERGATVLFDQLRRTKWFVDAIDDWRKSPQSSDVRAFSKSRRLSGSCPLESWISIYPSYSVVTAKRLLSG